MRFLGIQNCETEGFGLYQTLLREMGVEFNSVPAFCGSPLPPLNDYQAVLVGGTPVSACTAQNHPFLAAQEASLRSAIQGGKPCLGICFGAQLLAKILGGGVRKAKHMEIGGYELELTAAGKSEPLLRDFPPRFPVFHWHGDTFDLPPGARLLARGADCRNQMFRCGPAVGVLFHLEITAGEAASWAKAYSDELRLFGKSDEGLLSEIRGQEQEMSKLARIFVKNFVSWIKGSGAV
jgi:GMP synthase-like glutamine amidotransferase